MKSPKTGPIRHYGDLTYYACEGLVVITDETDGSYIPVIPADFANRISALKGMLTPTSRATSAQKDLNQRLRSTIGGMEECVKEARRMGDPSDPQVQAFWKRHRSFGRAVTTKGKAPKLSAGTDPGGYPTLPELELGKFTGRTAEADISLPGSAMPYHRPRRKVGKQGTLILDL